MMIIQEFQNKNEIDLSNPLLLGRQALVIDQTISFNLSQDQEYMFLLDLSIKTYNSYSI